MKAEDPKKKEEKEQCETDKKDVKEDQLCERYPCEPKLEENKCEK